MNYTTNEQLLKIIKYELTPYQITGEKTPQKEGEKFNCILYQGNIACVYRGRNNGSWIYHTYNPTTEQSENYTNIELYARQHNISRVEAVEKIKKEHNIIQAKNEWACKYILKIDDYISYIKDDMQEQFPEICDILKNDILKDIISMLQYMKENIDINLQAYSQYGIENDNMKEKTKPVYILNLSKLGEILSIKKSRRKYISNIMMFLCYIGIFKKEKYENTTKETQKKLNLYMEYVRNKKEIKNEKICCVNIISLDGYNENFTSGLRKKITALKKCTPEFNIHHFDMAYIWQNFNEKTANECCIISNKYKDKETITKKEIERITRIMRNEIDKNGYAMKYEILKKANIQREKYERNKHKILGAEFTEEQYDVDYEKKYRRKETGTMIIYTQDKIQIESMYEKMKEEIKQSGFAFSYDYMPEAKKRKKEWNAFCEDKEKKGEIIKRINCKALRQEHPEIKREIKNVIYF